MAMVFWAFLHCLCRSSIILRCGKMLIYTIKRKRKYNTILRNRITTLIVNVVVVINQQLLLKNQKHLIREKLKRLQTLNFYKLLAGICTQFFRLLDLVWVSGRIPEPKIKINRIYRLHQPILLLKKSSYRLI